LFRKAFDDLPFSRDDKLRIVDVGCGLGFLSCMCAQFYPNASVTGFDTFEHASLKDSSLEKARRNAKILGFSDRIVFQKGDIFRSHFRKKKFDLLISNLVFHNLGKNRFEAYKRLDQWTTPKSYMVLGDLFFDYKAEVKNLSGIFGSIKQIPGSVMGSAYKLLVLSQPRDSQK
jgi:SAM-dependent methyltransferase